ncbi:MAG: hypothetical protein PHU97_08385 [Bacteroidales bacterium]|nr:hypothetical protein [Bacteroidales bacterium]MDD3011319.1 hypothetical protein [Bacteroidales bacterium]MDD3962157.1 hypothetical protein [Bacteroidales bacterium]MDY0286815.1 hypothetical protein [Bacteroidales bacterium]
MAKSKKKKKERDHIPNKETIRAMKDAKQGKGTSVKNIEDLFEKLNS